MIDKDSLPLDKPRRTPSHPTKSHVVKTRVDGKEKIIRFGEQGASTAGKPKEGESEAMKQKRASFKARHAKNIAKGKSSPAYWANKTKWATGGSVELEDLDEKYEGIKKPDFSLLESFKDLIRTLQARAEDSGTQEFDPVRALGRSGAAGSLEDLYEAYSDKPAPHASRAETGAKDPKRTETAKMVFDSFKNAGFSDAQAKALTAEINREGSFNPAYLFGSHTDAANKATNVGMLSWQGDRANRLMSFMADRGLIDPAGRIAPGQDALNAQAEYLRWEMENDPSYTRTRETFLANPDIDQETAHDILGKNFIRWRIDDPKYRGSGFERISEGYDLLNMAQGYAEGGLAELAHKYDKGGKKKDDDELARASMLADLELMAQPKNPKAVPAEDPRLLNVGGLEERLALLNQTFNPVEAIGGAMRAGRDLMDPEAGGYDRLAALGNMLSGVAGVAGPAAVAKRIGAPAATAVMESLLGASPTAEAVADMARKYAVDESGALRLTRENAPLIAHHNLSPKGVEVSYDIGGIPMPSLAVSRADYPMTKFGDVTLLADPSMVTPSRGTSVWPADVYTGRQPRGDIQFANQRQAIASLKSDPVFGHMRDSTYWMDATNSFSDADEMMKTAQLGVEEGINPKAFDNMFDYVRDVRAKLGYDLYDKRDAMPGLSAYGEIERVLYPSDLFTASGTRRKPAPYTLENVMDRMTKERAFAPGSEVAMEASPGAFRAVMTKPFKSLSDIQSARGQIWPEEDMGNVAKAFSDAYDSLLEDVSAVSPNASWRAAPSALLDVALGRKPTWYGDIPEDVQKNVRILGETTRDMPTAYFEAKPKQAYRLSDFRAALVPEEDEATANILRSSGIKDVLTYGKPEEREALFRRFPELLFSAAGAAGAIGASQYDPDAIETTASRVRENKFAAGGAVKYDPAAVDGIINKLREVNRG